MDRKIIFIGIVVLLVLFGTFSACTSVDENFSVLEAEKESVLTANTSKQQFANDLNNVLENAIATRSNCKYNLTKEQLFLLQNSAVKMLKDEGMYSSNMDKLLKQNNAGIVFVGLMYLSLEKKSINSTRSNGKDADDEGECFSFEKLQSCIYSCGLSIIGLDAIEAIINGYIRGAGWVGCMTRLVVKQFLEKVSEAMLGFGVVLTIEMTACVWGCMEIK